MNISITEELLLKVAVSYLGGMYGDLEMSETKNLSIKYFNYQKCNFYLKSSEILSNH